MINIATRFLCWLIKGRIVNVGDDIVKVNVGSGLVVAPGWINIEGSLVAYFVRFPKFFLRFIYKISGVKKYFTQTEFVEILHNNRFICHNLEYGLPFYDGCVDYLYSSHVLDELSVDNSEKLLKEWCRVLK